MLCTYRVYRFDVPTRSWVLVLNTRLYRDAVDLHKQLMVHGQRAIINAELELRYFTPVIQKILSVKEKFGYSYWEAETTAGKVSFVLNNPFSNIRVLEDQRIYISDMDGNSFVIPDPTALDRASYRRIEVYI